MVKRMLIDATHAEETRVVVLDGTKLEEFDYETSTKKQIKGNIYLAKVTRVEPSLQAAFVEYGGNRHGFLAFSEIHPDYYRIPVADREALLDEARHEREAPAPLATQPAEAVSHEPGEEPHNGEGEAPVESPEVIGGDEEIEEAPTRRHRNFRNYKIQDVVIRRQIMLVQVVKEERGSKGAALTTYLSLAGRYCVLMPNTPRSGGVSRKITDPGDRKRLKTMLDEFEIPDGMAVIVRTAGMERPKAEVRRDYEYLMRLWDEIRTHTLESTAPALIHEEGDIVKRAIRDIYSRDIDEIQVAGEEAYKNAKAFMKMIVPSHTKRVQPYRDPIVPILHRYQVEAQLDLIHSPVVQLKSGGYIVINPTEALVSIDVNSGRATKERHIEETAVKTNIEAANEIARQLRLRDLAGLIVIDFIDMEENRNNAAVERCLKEAMKNDRARIQIGRISAFGLLELSRQRLRPSLLEASSERCIHCHGTGTVRSTESTALHVLRAIEEEGIKGRSAEIQITVPTSVALYILNHKRVALAGIEERYHLSVIIERDDTLIPPELRLDRLRNRLPGEEFPAPVMPVYEVEEDDDVAEDEPDEVAAEEQPQQPQPARNGQAGEEGGSRRKRRRRGRRRRPGESVEAYAAATEADRVADAADVAAGVSIFEDEGAEAEPIEAESVETDGGQQEPTEGGAVELGEDGLPKRRRRGRRGGRRRGRRANGSEIQLDAQGEPIAEDGGDDDGSEEDSGVEDGSPESAPIDDAIIEPTRPTETEPAAIVETVAVEPEQPAAAVLAATGDAVTEPASEVAEAPKPKPRRRAPRKTAEPAEPVAVDAATETPAEAAPKRPPRRRKPAVVASEPDAAPTLVVEATPPEVVAEPVAPESVVVAESALSAPEPAAEVTATDEPAPSPVIAGIDVVSIDTPVENPKRGWWGRIVR